MLALKILFLFIHANIWEGITSRINAGHGILITVIGLLTVFGGLVFLWAVTSLFPRLTARLEGKKYQSPKAEKTEPEAAEKDPYGDIAIAIGVALCCELEEEDISIITLRNIEQEVSPWVVASRQTTMRH